MDLYNYLTQGGKHEIKELWDNGEYRGYQVIDKYGNVLREKIFKKRDD